MATGRQRVLLIGEQSYTRGFSIRKVRSAAELHHTFKIYLL
jgi:hypothetical protein